jgi:hypothetical protein
METQTRMRELWKRFITTDSTEPRHDTATGDKTWFTSYETRANREIQIGNDAKLPIAGLGTVQTLTVNLIASNMPCLIISLSLEPRLHSISSILTWVAVVRPYPMPIQTPKRIRTDSGGEWLNQDTKKFAIEHGIQWEPTAPLCHILRIRMVLQNV